MSNTTRGTGTRAEGSRAPSTTRGSARVGRREALGHVAEAPSIAQLAWTILEYRYTVLVVVVLALGLVVLRLVLTSPSYESSVLVQVEGRTKTVPGFSDVSPLFDRESPAEAEMRIMRSRPLLQAVVEDLALDIEARPRRAPLLGAAFAWWRAGPGLAPAPFGLTRYAWGGERIGIARLEVPAELVGERLTLTAREGGRYDVAAPERGVILEGEVGKPAPSRSGLPRAEILVSELVARPGTEFVVVKRSAGDVVDALQASLRVAEQGKATGVVEVSLEDRSAPRVAAILNAIAETYVRQHAERTSADVTKTLRLLESQLPALKANMDKADVALNGFRRDAGAVNLSAEGESMLSRATDLDKKIAELEVEAAELQQRYSAGYPAVLALEERLKNLRAQRTALDQHMRALPGRELEAARLSRSSRLATELYLNVQNRAQELRIVKAGWIESVRVLEPAVVPARPASPKRDATIVLGLLLGIGAGVAAAFVRKGLDEGVEDPDEIEARTGLPVFGAIPRSAAQRALERRGRRRGPVEPLSLAAPGDVAVEDLRNLRTSVQFALVGAKNNIITISGPAPRVGKSFVSVNLAHLLAGAGRRVVLVDADLRRGRLHRHFGVERHPGLSDVLLGAATLETAVQMTAVPQLSFLPTGPLPSNPGELAASPRMEELLDELSRRYDAVVVDTPPILSVTDSALVGRHAGVNLLVLRAGEQTVREIAFTLRRLAQNGVEIRGGILNDLRPSAGGRYGRYGGYRLYSAYYVQKDWRDR
jgi:tyrosine-protein kinase Etk/Wzc